MKFINKDGYLELLSRVRTPIVNVRHHLEDNKVSEELSESIMKYLNPLEDLLSQISGFDGWEITEDSDCWSSGGAPDLNTYKAYQKGVENSKKGDI